MVFRNSSSSKRSARESWRTTRICASVIGGSSGSSGSATGAGTAAAGRSASAGAAGAVGGASGLGFGLFLEPGGLPRRLGAGGAGSGSGGAAGAVGGAGAGAGVGAVGSRGQRGEPPRHQHQLLHILKTPSLAEPCRCTVSPMSNSKSSSRPAARFRLSIQIVVIAFFLLPNYRLAGPGTLAAEYVESAEICCAQGCGCCHCCCIQGGLDGS